jgi:hypothetical protein
MRLRGGWPAMRGFRVVACAATTMLLSDGLVATVTLVVGSCSGVSEGPSSWSSHAVKSELRCVGPVATMPCDGRYGCDGLLRHESCISPLRSSLSESELPVSCARSHLFGIGRYRLHEAIAMGSSLVVVLR